jgi:hypothetical protein
MDQRMTGHEVKPASTITPAAQDRLHHRRHELFHMRRRAPLAAFGIVAFLLLVSIVVSSHACDGPCPLRRQGHWRRNRGAPGTSYPCRRSPRSTNAISSTGRSAEVFTGEYPAMHCIQRVKARNPWRTYDAQCPNSLLRANITIVENLNAKLNHIPKGFGCRPPGHDPKRRASTTMAGR